MVIKEAGSCKTTPLKKEDLFQSIPERSGHKVIVNVLSYEDLEVFTLALLKAESKGKRFLFRTAASFVKVYGAIRGLLKPSDFAKIIKRKSPGLVVVGSYVQKTTKQLNRLLEIHGITPIEVNVSSLLSSDGKRQHKMERVARQVDTEARSGRTPVVYTSRQNAFVHGSNVENNLERVFLKKPDYLLQENWDNHSGEGLTSIRKCNEGLMNAFLKGEKAVTDAADYLKTMELVFKAIISSEENVVCHRGDAV